MSIPLLSEWLNEGDNIKLSQKDVSKYTILLVINMMRVCQAMRLFVGDPVWTPFNRPHDHLPARFDFVGLLMVALEHV